MEICHAISLLFLAHRVAILNKSVHLHVNSWPEIFHWFHFIHHHRVCAFSVDSQLSGFVCAATYFDLVLMKIFTFMEIFCSTKPILKIKAMKQGPSVNPAFC